MAVDLNSIDQIKEEFQDLTKEFSRLQDVQYVEYTKKAADLHNIQSKCKVVVDHQNKRLKTINSSMHKLQKSDLSEEDRKICDTIKEDMKERQKKISEIQLSLPKRNGLLLRLILGQVNLTLLSEKERFDYKDEYETFKLNVTTLSLALTFINILISNTMLDHLYHFILVWYYCTVTIREHILRLNGSRIKGWWIIHHYFSAILSCILLVSPTNERYYAFRETFNYYSLFQGFVQVLQYYYQRGCLYRLKTLGETDKMVVTGEGFRSFMWRGLSFLLPFLFAIYIFQLYSAYTLFKIANSSDCHEWQFAALGLLFLALASGNIITTLGVINHKLRRTPSKVD